MQKAYTRKTSKEMTRKLALKWTVIINICDYTLKVNKDMFKKENSIKLNDYQLNDANNELVTSPKFTSKYNLTVKIRKEVNILKSERSRIVINLIISNDHNRENIIFLDQGEFGLTIRLEFVHP